MFIRFCLLRSLRYWLLMLNLLLTGVACNQDPEPILEKKKGNSDQLDRKNPELPTPIHESDKSKNRINLDLDHEKDQSDTEEKETAQPGMMIHQHSHPLFNSSQPNENLFQNKKPNQSLPNQSLPNQSLKKELAEPSSLQNLLPSLGEAFNLKVVRSSVFDPTPQSSQEASVSSLVGADCLSEVIYDENSIRIQKVLFLQDVDSQIMDNRKRIYFIWTENSLGLKLISATFTHQWNPHHRESKYVADHSLNKRVQHQKDTFRCFGDLTQRNLGHNVRKKFWFLSVDDLFKVPSDLKASLEQFVNQTPEAEHKITFELIFENYQLKIVDVYFRVCGPLPKLIVEAYPADEPTRSPKDVLSFLDKVLREGWIMQKIKIVNPYQRAFGLNINIPLQQLKRDPLASLETVFFLQAIIRSPWWTSKSYRHESGQIETQAKFEENLEKIYIDEISQCGFEITLQEYAILPLKSEDPSSKTLKGVGSSVKKQWLPLDFSQSVKFPAQSNIYFRWTIKRTPEERGIVQLPPDEHLTITSTSNTIQRKKG